MALWQGIENAPEIVKACVNSIKRNAGEYGVIVITDIKLPLWSIKRPDYLHASIASGYFAGYSLGCGYEDRWMFAVIRDFLFNYWKECDKLIDYLLVDYAVVISEMHNKEIADAFAKIEPNNTYCDELFKVLGQPYDERVWHAICKDTFLYKLTWKQSFPKEINGKPTFYGMLLEDKLH